MVGFVDDVFFFFFSSLLSQALGNPKPFWFGFPLVFSWPRSRYFNPYSEDDTLHPRFTTPHLLFFFFSLLDVVRLSSGGWSVVCRWSLSGLSPSLFLGGSGALVCMHASHEIERGGGLLDGAPVYYLQSIVSFWGIEREAVSRTVRPEPLVLPPPPPAVP